MSRQPEWHIMFRTHGVTDPRVSAFSIGDGFPKFMEENNVDLGTLLVIERVDVESLHVTIYRRPDETTPVLTPPPSPQTDLRPHFRKTLRATNVRVSKSTRLDIPTAFWRSLGEERFNGAWYTLEGPLHTVLVKSGTYSSAKQTFCFLTKGWIDFVAMNRLKLGDTVVFTLVGVAEFEVTMV
ncbi:hypothetical protein M758_3G219100 [Ceratodon purpureus]|nr:hypothetical protein M758_3G219100 [Ceratodon purpureus]